MTATVGVLLNRLSELHRRSVRPRKTVCDKPVPEDAVPASVLAAEVYGIALCRACWPHHPGRQPATGG